MQTQSCNRWLKSSWQGKGLARPGRTNSIDFTLQDELKPSWADKLLERLRCSFHERGIFKCWYYIALAISLAWAAMFFTDSLGCSSVKPTSSPTTGTQTTTTATMVIVKPPKHRPIVRVSSPIAVRLPTVDIINIDLFVPSKLASRIPSIGDGNPKSGNPGDEYLPGNELCFYRLEHSGANWDDSICENSDINMARKYKALTGGKMAVSSATCRARDLARCKPGESPAFIYVTGTGGIGLSGEDRAALRDYLLNQGGMLFADSAGQGFAGGMNQLASEVLPGSTWVDVSNDDEIFCSPVDLSGGQYPILWHHTGMRVMGIKYQGRWVVIWHPGELNDAWKTGNEGIAGPKAQKAYEMGANIISYACRKQWQFTRERNLPGGTGTKRSKNI